MANIFVYFLFKPILIKHYYRDSIHHNALKAQLRRQSNDGKTDKRDLEKLYKKKKNDLYFVKCVQF